MANRKHVEILKHGVKAWNKWRRDNPKIIPNLSKANLSWMRLSTTNTNARVLVTEEGINLRKANLSGANLGGAILHNADLTNANLSNAYLGKTDLMASHLTDTDFSHATMAFADLESATLVRARFDNSILTGSNFTRADLQQATFKKAVLALANLNQANLAGSDFNDARIGGTIFGDNDLRFVKGLATVTHYGPSAISIDTLFKSTGNISDIFLRGCGVPDDFIAFIPSHFGLQQAIQFYSCFISYSTKDDEFARRLYSRMRDEKLRVWFAPEDIKGGQKLQEQIERAIQLHDRLLIVLSDDSMRSDWVITEIQRARETEIKEDRRKLFPITIVDFDKVKAWNRFDADTGRDLAKEVREYYIPDFSNWKDHDSFEKAFDRLLRDLKAEDKQATQAETSQLSQKGRL